VCGGKPGHAPPCSIRAKGAAATPACSRKRATRSTEALVRSPDNLDADGHDPAANTGAITTGKPMKEIGCV